MTDHRITMLQAENKRLKETNAKYLDALEFFISTNGACEYDDEFEGWEGENWPTTMGAFKKAREAIRP